MKKLPLLTLTLLALIFSITASSQTPSKKPDATAKVSPLVEPAVDIESLLAKDSYAFYAEIRMPGRLAASTQVDEFFEAMKTLDAMPQEATRLRDFILKHAEDLDSSRIVVAGFPARPGVPNGLTAIQFESPEAAAKMQPLLAEYALNTAGSLIGRLTGSKDQGKPAAGASGSVEAQLAALGVNIKRSGALICIADQKIDFAALRPARSKPMSADPNFQAGRSRFAVEPLFVYYNVRVQERVQAEQNRKWRAEAEAEKSKAAQQKQTEPGRESQTIKRKGKLEETDPSFEITETMKDGSTQSVTNPSDVAVEVAPSPEASPTPAPTPNPSARALSKLMDSIFDATPTWPDAVAGAASFEGDDLGLKLILLDHSGKKIGPVPFLSAITTGHPISTGASALAPDNADIFVSMSLDLPATLDAALASPQKTNQRLESEPVKTSGSTGTEESASVERQIAILETLLGFKIKEELFAAFGNEVAIAVDTDPPASEQKQEGRRGNPAPVVAIFFSLNDKAAAQRMLPKVVQLIGAGGGAPTTEQYKDVEINSYGQLAMAFVDDFVVFSPELEQLKRVIDKRAGGQSLASTQAYRNAVYWQPPQRLAQAYIASHLIESNFTEGSVILDYAGDQGREFIARFRPEPRPVSFSLSNDGSGYLYDLHIPNSSLLRWAAEMATASRYSEILGNETSAKMVLTMIASSEEVQKSYTENGSYVSLEELVKKGNLPKELLESKTYKVGLNLTNDGFEATATPVEYGDKSRRSFFVDASGTMRGGDLGGRRANAADPELKR